MILLFLRSNFIRMAKPMGRSDDMLIIRGVNVFCQIEAVLIQEGYGSNYQIIVSREHHSDKLDLYVEMNPILLLTQSRDFRKEKNLSENSKLCSESLKPFILLRRKPSNEMSPAARFRELLITEIFINEE